MSVFTSAFVAGFLLGGGLIIAIGAQNAYVLRMGLLRQHVFLLCLFCAVSDSILIAAGVGGMGALITAVPSLLFAVTLFGALFLAAYAVLAAKRALHPEKLQAAKAQAPSLLAAVAICASLTFLNPHVYLDTVILIGSFSAQYAGPAKLAFAVGAMASSFCWFFSLGYGARLLAPLFQNPRAWQILDWLIAIIMATLSTGLFLSLL